MRIVFVVLKLNKMNRKENGDDDGSDYVIFINKHDVNEKCQQQ